MVIREDSVCAEATPPWGASSTEEYADRVSRNLNIIERDKNIKLNYEFGAYELEDLVNKHPDLYERMKKMVASGQLFFVNGTYNQPHGQALSLEANIRQFEHGLVLYKKLFGVNIKTHAMQEPDYTNQTPQLCRAFGIEFASYGAFIHHLITPLNAGPEPSLLYRWIGLDGTEIPLTVDQNGQGINYDYKVPSSLQKRDTFINFRIPDMDEFETHEYIDYVALDQAIEDQLADSPPVVAAQLQLPWSYVEGTDAESLLLATGEAEIALIQAETMTSLLADESSRDTLLPLWAKWLQGQHHDALWHGAPELRAASVAWCRESAERANVIVEKLMAQSISPEGPPAIRMITSFPIRHQGVARLQWQGAAPVELHAESGVQVPVQIDGTDPKNKKLLIPYGAEGIEELVYLTGEGNAAEQSGENLKGSFAFSNAYYDAAICGYGGVSRVFSKTGDILLANTAVRTVSSTTGALKMVAEGGEVQETNVTEGWTEPDETHYRYGLDAAGALTVMQQGRMFSFALSGYSSRLFRGPVADIVVSTGRVGDIPVTRKTYLYHGLPWIEMEIICSFSDTVVDEYAEDANKLCIWWPCSYRHLIQNGIPGGNEVPSKPEIGFLPVNWIDLDQTGSRDSGGGFAVAFDNALKTFRRSGRLGSVLGWGDDQGHFNNRVEPLQWRNVQDLRLKGQRIYRFFLFPHQGNWRQAGVPQWAFSRLRPPVLQLTNAAAASRKGLLSLEGSGVLPTSVQRDQEGLKVRFHECCGEEGILAQVKHREAEAQYALFGLDKKPLERIGAYKIGEIRIS